MADFDFGGLLGNAFGANSGSEIEKLLTAQQRQKLGTQSALSAAAALLQAGGRGPQRVSLGQALGSALQAGQGAYERGTSGAINELMLGQKLKEMQAEAAGNESWRRLLGGAPSPVAATGAAQPMPTGAAVPTAEQEMAAPAPTAADQLAFLNPVQRALIANMPRKEGMSEVLNVA